MKLKHALIIFILGYCFNFIGALFKITHAQNADIILTIGTIFQIVGLISILIKLLTHPKVKDFLNW